MAKQAILPPHRSVNLKMYFAAALAVLFIGGVIVLAKPGATGTALTQPIETKTVSTQPSAMQASVAQPNRLLNTFQPTFDFGSISMAAGKVSHKYWIRNTGDAPVVIRKMYTSCMCTTAALVTPGKRFAPVGMPGHGIIPSIDQPINPKEAAVVEVVFDPAAHGPAGIGRVERVVTIQTDRERPLELAFVATVTP